MTRTLIIGAGIGGLTCAIALRRLGLEVELVEQASSFAPLGAGIGLQPNATAVLAALGVRLDPADIVPIGEFTMLDSRGRSLMQGSAGVGKSEHQAVNIRRCDLHRALVEALGDATVHFDHTLVDLEPRGDRVVASFAGGGQLSADLLIGADGLHSAVRRVLLPASACAPRYSGQTCWRMQVEAPDLVPEVTIERWSPGRRVGLVPLSRGGIYAYLVQSAPRGTPGPGSSTFNYLRRNFLTDESADKRLVALLERASETATIHHGDLCDLPSLSYGRGRVLLIGDAAHAMTPNLGQGAGAAIEDAAALALSWAHGTPVLELADSLTRMCLARVTALQRGSWQLGKVAHLRNPVVRAFRDFALRSASFAMTEGRIEQMWAPGLELAGQLRGLER